MSISRRGVLRVFFGNTRKTLVDISDAKKLLWFPELDKVLTMRKTPIVLALGLFTISAGTAFAGAPECAFDTPPGWEKARIVWFGSCAEGRADGLGVLRAYMGGKPGDAFFGRLAHGALTVGVMETEGGYAAGDFANGRALETDERQKLIDAFRTGAEAARAASALFKQQNNPGSAQFYAEQADKLSRQMD
jgi:hypothetical protein